MSTQPPGILLVYATGRVDPAHQLRRLAAEIGLIRCIGRAHRRNARQAC
jgi:hypothetical protein